MDQDFNQQQNQQQQPPQQQYHPQYAPRPRANLSGIANRAADAFVIIMYILAVLSVLYYFIFGIVDAAGAFTGGFSTFLRGFTTGIARAAQYFFFGTLIAVLKRK